MSWGTIAFAVRMGKCPDPLFFHSWTSMLTQGCLRNGDGVLPPAIELPHHWAACSLAEQFLTQTDCESILFIDDDMVFSPEEFKRLRDNPAHDGFDIVQALYVSRKAGYPPVVLKPTAHPRRFVPYMPKAGDGMIETGGAGLGFTLIRRRAFYAIQAKGGTQPFFDFNDKSLGEDFSFCIKARAAGCRVAVDCGVSVGHRVTLEVRYNVAEGRTEQSGFFDRPYFDLVRKLAAIAGEESEEAKGKEG